MDNDKNKTEYSSSSVSPWAYILIGIGVFWLISNVINIWQFWPLLLIGVGFLMLNGQLRPGTVEEHHFSAPVEGATDAHIRLDFSVGDATITPDAPPGSLIEADVVHLGSVNFSDEGEASRRIRVNQEGTSFWSWLNPANWFNVAGELKWDVRLNGEIPLDLGIKDGAGRARVDLSGMNLTRFAMKGGAGEMDVTLPASPQSYHAQVEVGLGELEVHIEDGANIDLDLKGGVGEVTVYLPRESGVRLEAESGLGEIKVPARLEQITSAGMQGIGGSGVWETVDYGNASNFVTITFKGGIGELKVR
jgi:hypothetical protein